MSNGFVCDLDMLSRFLLEQPLQLNEQTNPMSQPLRSAPTSRQQELHRYYELVRRRTPRRYSMPSVAASARSLSPTGWLQAPSERPDVSMLAFPRSMREPQTKFTPPPRRTPPGQ